MRRLHVAVRSISPSGGFGGLEKSAAEHVREMRARGIEVVVYAPGLNEGEGVPVAWPFPSRPRSVFQGLAYTHWVRKLGRILADSVKPGDVAHFHGSAAAAARFLPASVSAVMNPHGLEEFDHLSASTVAVRPLLRRLSLAGAMSCSRVVSTDISISASIVTKLGVPESKIALIPNSVDAMALRRAAAVHAPTRSSQKDVDITPLRVVSIGRLERNKGYDLLASALIACPAYSWEWVHYGSGSQMQTVLDMFDRSGMRSRLRIVQGASDSEVQYALSDADLFVQPSRSEGSSLTTLEAMAHGRFILGTAVGGIPDKITNGWEGLLSAPSVEGLTVAVREALAMARSPAARLMGERAQARVEREFSAAAASSAYLRLYEELSVRA